MIKLNEGKSKSKPHPLSIYSNSVWDLPTPD